MSHFALEQERILNQQENTEPPHKILKTDNQSTCSLMVLFFPICGV